MTLRLLRHEGHSLLDPLWQFGGMTRFQAYRWLSERMGIHFSKTHFGMFDKFLCRKAIHILKTQIPIRKKKGDSRLANIQPITASAVPAHRLKQPWLPALYRYYEAQGHSPWGASGRDRYSKCPGSARIIATLPPVKQKSNKYADRGTLAHEAAAAYLNYVLKGGTPPDRSKLDEELNAQVEFYVQWVLAKYNSYGGIGKAYLWVEKRICLDEAHPEASGSTDAMIYDIAERHLDVIDFKSGQHEVDAVENKQLLFYGAGSYWELKKPVDTAALWIIQPPAPSGIREKGFGIMGDRLYAETYTIQKEIEACEQPDAPLVVGDHCGYCPAAAVCPARNDETFALAVHDFAPLSVSPPLADGEEPGVSFGIQGGYDPDVLAACFEALPRIEKWVKQVRHFAHAEAAHGRPPPGFKLVEKRKSPAKWKNEAQARAVFDLMLDSMDALTLEKPRALVTPTQAGKLLPEMRDLITGLSKSESSGVTLVKLTDGRAAIDNDPVADFSDLIMDDETEE